MFYISFCTFENKFVKTLAYSKITTYLCLVAIGQQIKIYYIMAYSLYHVLSTTVMENNATLECLEFYLKGEDVFSKEELLQMIKNARQHNNNLYEKSNLVIDDIKKEIF